MGLFNNIFKKKNAGFSKGGSVPTEENLDPPPIPNSAFNSDGDNIGSNNFFAKNRDPGYDAKSPEIGNYASPPPIPKNYTGQENLQHLEIPEYAPMNFEKDEKSLSEMFDKLKSKATQDIPESGQFPEQKSVGVGLDKEFYPSQATLQKGTQSESKEIHDDVSGLTLPPLYPTNGNPELSGIYNSPVEKAQNPLDIESIKPFENAQSAKNLVDEEKDHAATPENIKAISSTMAYSQLKSIAQKGASVVDVSTPVEKPHPKTWEKPFLNVVDFNNVFSAMNSVITESKIAGEAISRIEGINHEMELQYTDWQKTIESFENNIIKLDKIIYKEKATGD
jgi:hypothetical protein